MAEQEHKHTGAPEVDAAEPAAAVGAMATPAITPAPLADATANTGASAAAAGPGKSSPPPQRPAARSATPGRAPLYLLALLGLAGLGGLLYQQLTLQQTVAELSGGYAQLLQARNAAELQFTTLQAAREQLAAELQQQLRAAQDTATTQSSQLDALNRELVTLRLRVNDTGTGAGGAWRLTEAESLLRLAQQRLMVGREARPALGLTLSADELLKPINDPAVFRAREALALDIAELQAVQDVDVPGLHARLGAAIERVDALTVQPQGEPPAFRPSASASAATSAPAAAPASWWRSALNTLSQYFVITREADKAIPQLTAEQTWVIKEQVKLSLEQARVALLRGEATLYAATLDEALNSIDTLLQGTGKERLLEDLRSLRAAPILAVVPPANRGLEVLRKLQPGVQSEGAPTPESEGTPTPSEGPSEGTPTPSERPEGTPTP